MRILVCNDDGAGSPGLLFLAEAALALAPDVWIVAPQRKWTAASHQLTFDRELVLTRSGEKSYVCSGAPADCVVAAMSVLFAGGTRPDLVLAGINDKRNVAEDVAYSGTTAIAREASFWGVPAISVSREKGQIHGSAELEALRRLLCFFWNVRADWAADGHWLSVNLPASLPAPLKQARIGRDKIGGSCDIVSSSEERLRFRIRRGRPGTVTPDDENACLAAGEISLVRYCWFAEAELPDAVIAAWRSAAE
jgi:5'-nucleotidase